MHRTLLQWGVAVVVGLTGCTDTLRDVEAEGALELPAACVDFGVVPPGGSAVRELVLHNPASGLLELFESSVVEGPFTILEPPGQTIEPGASASMRIRFAPRSLGAARGSVRIRSSDPNAPTQEACLRGLAGGPDIVCDTTSIDFGEVPVGLERRARFTCSNRGSSGTTGLLELHAMDADSNAVQLSIRNDDGSSGTKPEGYASGEGFEVLVRFVPQEAGTIDSTIAILSNDVLEPTVSIPVRGEASRLAPCALELPEAIDFGLVLQGRRKVLPLTLTNAGSDRCILWDVNLAADGGGAFAMANKPRLEIPAGESVDVNVAFFPDEPSPALAGEVTMQISDPAASSRSVALRGRSLPPCLAFVPEAIDFGQVAPGCASGGREIRLVNTCADPIELQELHLPDVPFAVAGTPEALPVTLPGYGSLPLEVRVQPEGEGAASATLVATTHDGHSVAEATLAGEGDSDPALVDTMRQRNVHRVDLLWVIDNSASMQPYQTVLAQGMQAFLHYALDNDLDFQVGVTTTGLEAAGTSIDCPGGVDGGEDGRLFPVDGSRPRILTPETPDLVGSWAGNVAVGTCSSAERGFDAAIRALTPPVIDSADDPRHPEPNDGNLGFLRGDAHLAVVFLTDEEEQSGLPVQHYFDRLASLKGVDRPDRLSIHALAGDPGTGCNGSRGTARPGDRFAALAARAGGLFESVCVDDWSAPLQRIGAAAFGLQVRFPLTNDCADRDGDGSITDGDGEVEVLVGGSVVPSDDAQGQRAWRYVDGAIEFYWPHIPAAGRTVEVRCTPACH